jgi:glycosyltransferase involved in cell wall biosynthesis
MRTVVSVTPIAVERDSRTYKQAASLARLGYRSLVLEGDPSSIAGAELPFELLTVGGKRHDGDAPAPPEPDPPSPAPSTNPSIAARLLERLRRLGEPPLALLANLRWNLRTFRSLPKADLYWLHSYNQFPAVRARARGRAYVYDAHDSYFEVYPDDGDGYRSRWTPRLFAAIERRCVRGAREFVTVSDGVAGLLESRFGRRPAVIRNCPDLRLDKRAPRSVREVAGVPDDAFLLVAVGNAKPGMTVAEGLRAVARLPERVHIAFVGGGMEAFRPLVAQLGIGERAHLLPPVPPTEVTSFMEGADAAPVLYYAITPNFMNALPNRFFHAVAAGLPILYPPLAEITKLSTAHDLGLPIDPRDPDSIAAAVGELIDDPARAEEFGANVRAAREELSWEHEERLVGDLVTAQIGEGG